LNESTAVLNTFAVSHFCESARWTLDYKGIEYAEESWAPLLHVTRTWRMKRTYTRDEYLDLEGLRAEVGERGVGVSVICPGFVAKSGMFADYGKRAPKIAGESLPAEVAEATLQAVLQNRGEVIINPGPTRLLLLANALSPDATTWLLKAAGLHAFYERISRHNAAQRSAARPV